MELLCGLRFWELGDPIISAPLALPLRGVGGLGVGLLSLTLVGETPPCLQGQASLRRLLKNFVHQFLREQLVPPDVSINEPLWLMTDFGMFQHMLPELSAGHHEVC